MLLRVVRGGRELTISEDKVGEYLRSGYSLIDSKGQIVEKGVPLTYEAALKERTALLNRIKVLEAELAEATAKKQRKPKETAKTE